MGDTTPTTRPALAWGVSTDPGRVRDENEDSYVAEPMVLGIADGMDGHQAGEVASMLAVDIMPDRLGGGPMSTASRRKESGKPCAAAWRGANRLATSLGNGKRWRSWG